MGGLVIGVDSSTGATKVEVVDLQTGTVVATSRSPHPPTTPPVSEQDPEVWWAALLACLTDVATHLGQVRAIGVGGQQHGLVVLDAEDRPVRPAKLWNDTTSAPQSAALIEALGADHWAATAGSLPGPSFTVTKLAWLADNEPDHLSRVARIGLPHDYLNLRLTGNWVTDRGDASGTGYWSPGSGSYAIEGLGPVSDVLSRVELPRVANPFASIGTVSSPELLALGLGPDTIVAPGTGDNMAAALGLGLLPGDVVVSLGTSGTAYAVSDRATADESGLVAGFADATGRFLPLVCTLNATKVPETVRRLLDVGYADFDRLALDTPQGANGVTLVPYFDGERTPNRPDATGAIVGLRNSAERGDLARAAVEGVACGLLDGVDALQDGGVPTNRRFFLIGGGSKSEAFTTVFANLAERPIIVPDSPETVARGGAVQAACVVSGSNPAAIADQWALGTGTTTDPAGELAIPAVDVRSRYRNAAASR